MKAVGFLTTRKGKAPLIVSIPHAGTEIPESIAASMSDSARARPDTDWFVDQLYDFLDEIDASLLATACSRYVIDVNRSDQGGRLYPGQHETVLCPTQTFAQQAIYKNAHQLDQAGVAARVANYWRPYHQWLAQEIERQRQKHGVVVPWDAHSIRHQVPWLFDGELPDLNLGTADGKSCDPGLARNLLRFAQTGDEYSAVLNGRFKGGFITRRYGDPARGVHAVQLELAQRCYMDETSIELVDDGAARLRRMLRSLLQAALEFCRHPP